MPTWVSFLSDEELKEKGRAIRNGVAKINSPFGRYIFKVYKEKNGEHTLVVQFKGKFKPDIWRVCAFGFKTRQGLNLIPTDTGQLGAIITLTEEQSKDAVFLYNDGIFEVPFIRDGTHDTFDYYMEWVYKESPEVIFTTLINRVKGLHQLKSFDYGDIYNDEEESDY